MNERAKPQPARCRCGYPIVDEHGTRSGVNISLAVFDQRFWKANGGTGAPTGTLKLCNGCGQVAMDLLERAGFAVELKAPERRPDPDEHYRRYLLERAARLRFPATTPVEVEKE